jgi:DNA-binding response OmpR family regulator
MGKPVDFPVLLGNVQQILDQPLLLVVDDDRDLCANLWDLLRDQGYRVCLAHDEKEAAAQLKNRPYRVILIDMKLPHGDGTKVFRLVRENNPNARTVLITGYRSEMEHLIKNALSEGADALCYKPFDVPRLLTTLQELAETK